MTTQARRNPLFNSERTLNRSALARVPMADRFLRGKLLERLAQLREGRVTIAEAGEVRSFGSGGMHATITVHSPRFYRDVALGGSIGAAEAFLDGSWSCDDLTALFRILLRNAAVMDRFESGLARVGAAAARRVLNLRRNTVAGSRRNIHEHYDLGNDFFRLFLDESMTYSAAIFERPESTLFEASMAKIDRLCRKLTLRPEDHLVEIGAGWGALAVHAAGRYGCRVTTTTISRQQFDIARERIARAGLADRITLLLEDYRNLKGAFSKLVSVEMIEAVGHEYLGEYFRTCARLLTPEGTMAIQAIVMAEHRYSQYLRTPDFIQRYVFPGSHIPAVSALMNATAQETDLTVLHLEDITPHYARTLREWRQRFLSRVDDVRALGYPDRFLRLWNYYFCYCEAGFEERNVMDIQLVMGRPRSGRTSILGAL
jgi:cyclopropane-fatty-acyl-phospholipid synthase